MLCENIWVEVENNPWHKKDLTKFIFGEVYRYVIKSNIKLVKMFIARILLLQLECHHYS